MYIMEPLPGTVRGFALLAYTGRMVEPLWYRIWCILAELVSGRKEYSTSSPLMNLSILPVLVR